MLSLLFCLTLAHASAPQPAKVKVQTIAVSGSAAGSTASELISVLRKLGVKSTKSGDTEEFLISKGRLDRTGFGSCNPHGPGDYVGDLEVLDSNSREPLQQLSFESRGCEANAPAAALDALMIRFGQDKVGTADHLGTVTYWIGNLSCEHDTRSPAKDVDQCSVMLNSADLVPGWL